MKPVYKAPAPVVSISGVGCLLIAAFAFLVGSFFSQKYSSSDTAVVIWLASEVLASLGILLLCLGAILNAMHKQTAVLDARLAEILKKD
jgi:hypothetical protein